MYTICLVEDEDDLNSILTLYLKKNDWDVISCKNVSEGQMQLTKNINLWILDIMLPDGNGFELLGEIKKADRTKPVILISARGDSIDRVLGFELGCDDYIAKPFLPKELIYRVSKIFNSTFVEKAEKKMYIGPYLLNESQRTVTGDKESVDLTSKEFDLLLYFAKHKEIALSREQLLIEIWGTDFFGSDRSIDNYIKNIRKKLPRVEIETIYGYGYRCNA